MHGHRSAPLCAALATLLLLAGCDDHSQINTGGENVGTLICQAGFSVTSDTPLLSVVTAIDYSELEGTLGADGIGTATCRSLVAPPFAFRADNHCEDACLPGDERELVTQVHQSPTLAGAGNGTSTPLFSCQIAANASADPSQLVIARVNATSLDIDEVTVEVALTSFECSEPEFSTTTTTLPACQAEGCGEGEVCGAEGCVDEEIRRIVFRVDKQAGFGSLQFSSEHDPALGTFATEEGTGRPVCRTTPGIGALHAENLFPAVMRENCTQDCWRQELLAGLITPTAIQGPTDVLACEFRVGLREPTAEDFLIRVIAAADPDAQHIPGTTVSISAIEDPAGGN
jgi:hypothetical protein